MLSAKASASAPATMRGRRSAVVVHAGFLSDVSSAFTGVMTPAKVNPKATLKSGGYSKAPSSRSSSAKRGGPVSKMAPEAPAGPADFFGMASAFVSIFSPSSSSVPWAGNAGYAAVPAKGAKGAKPFADGYAKIDVSAAADEAPNGLGEYMAGAMRRVLGNNFVSTDDEGVQAKPQWSKTGRAGYTGNTVRRTTSGFHSRVL